MNTAEAVHELDVARVRGHQLVMPMISAASAAVRPGTRDRSRSCTKGALALSTPARHLRATWEQTIPVPADRLCPDDLRGHTRGG